MRGSVPYRQLGHRVPRRCRREVWNRPGRARRDPGPAATGCATTFSRRRQGDPAFPLRAVEEPREPHREPAAKLDWIAKTSPRLHRACPLKEGLRTSSSSGAKPGSGARPLAGLGTACRIPGFVGLAQQDQTTPPAIEPPCDTACRTRSSNRSTPRSGSSPAWPSASTTRALIALALLALGGYRPDLPGRNDPRISHKSPLSTACSAAFAS